MSEIGPEATAKRVAGGVAWNYAGSSAVIVAQILYTAVTARILLPSDFGTYATAQALITLMGYFSLAALGNTLTRMPAISRHTIGTALWLSAVAGLATALVAIAVAAPWANAWQTPKATTLIVLSAPGIVLSSLAAIPLGLLRRRLRYASAAMIESISVILGFLVGGILVLSLRSPSALVLGQVAGAAAMLGGGLLVVRSELVLRFSRAQARNLLSFSGHVSGQNLAHYGIYILPGFVIARGFGSATLGFFSRANLLVTLPMHFVTTGISKAVYPALPRLKDLVTRRRALADVLAIGTYVVWPALALLAGSSSLVVRLLFGPGWEPAAALITPICAFAAANLAYDILASATESLGWLRVGWSIQAAWAAALVLATGIAWQMGASARLYLYACAAAQVSAHALQIVVLARRGAVSLRRVGLDEFVAGFVAVPVFLFSRGASELLQDSSIPLRIAGTGLVAFGTGAAMLCLLPRVSAGRALSQRGLLPARLTSMSAMAQGVTRRTR